MVDQLIKGFMAQWRKAPMMGWLAIFIFLESNGIEALDQFVFDKEEAVEESLNVQLAVMQGQINLLTIRLQQLDGIEINLGGEMINKHHLRKYVVENTLQKFENVKPGAYSEDAVALLMGTAAIESSLGFYLSQANNGPAKGVWQVEGSTHVDNWVNYLRYQPQAVIDFVKGLMSVNAANEVFIENTVRPDLENSPILDAEMVNNMAYNMVHARIKYLRDSYPLPDSSNSYAMGEYYKRVYNTEFGKSTVADFVEKYEGLVL